ncbi:uncharacterized protein Swt1 [Bactrocera oleae]|uniref:uncharacterized protein Swt1 n=1 Tax=Bactrocera oleae TaxID=104688 RepID=UPI00387E7FD2
MEKRQLRNSTSKTDEWIKCQSKQRPGQYYMFNKGTGETKWCGEFKDDLPVNKSNDNKKPATLPKNISTKSIRTPAQDRLKRLQHDLKKDHKEKLTQKQTNSTRRQRSQEQVVAISKENENGATKDTNNSKNKNTKTKSTTVITPIDSRKDCQPSTSKNALLANKETDKRTTANNSSQKNTKSKQKSPKNQTKKRTSADATVETTQKRQKRPNQELPFKEKDPANTDDTKIEATSHQQTAAVSGIGSGIVNKIKAICKSTFNSYCNAKNALSQKPLKPCIKQNNFKIPKKPSGAQHSTNLSVQTREPENRTAYEDGSESDMSNHSNDISTTPMTIVMKGTAMPSNGDATVDFKAIALTTMPSQLYGASQNRALPYPHGSANTRLERLRNSLNQQAFANGQNLSTPTRLCASACSSALACVLRDTAMAEENTANVDEPMDWMPIEEIKTETIELSSNESSNQHAETMGEYYGTVNENLLRCAVEHKFGAASTIGRWLNDYYYFVLDTNVLLQHLAFLEELCHMTLCDTGGTILYIPYSVLQELDKLKQFAVGDGTKVLAVRAIKYLNSKFEAKNKHLQAQSALSELEHLVEITSPDDRIINCCLQVKQQIDHIILLTEDINLRNKAICNNILVSTKSDLVAKHT